MNNRLKPTMPAQVRLFLSRFSLLLLFLLSMPFLSDAQEAATPTPKKPLIRFREWQYALGTKLGTSGIGADLAFRLNPHWHLRTGLNYLQGSFGQSNLDLGAFGLSDNTWVFRGKIIQHAGEVFIDYAVLQEQVRLVFGLAIHPGNRINGNFVLRDSVQFNELTVAPAELGQIEVSMHYGQLISPYLGLGLGRIVPWKRLSLGLDAGAYFRGKPKAALNATGLLKTNENNRQTLQENLENKRIWPALNLRLGLRFL